MDKDARELIEALNALEKEKNISKDVLFEAIENAILMACKNQYKDTENRDANFKVIVDRETGSVKAYIEYEVVDEVENPQTQITVDAVNARFPDTKFSAGDVARIELVPKDFGRIAAGAAKNAVVQKIREEERNQLFRQYKDKENLVVSGIVQRIFGVGSEKKIAIHLGKCDGILPESEKIKGENLTPGQRVKVYVLEVKNENKGPKITLSRTHPDLVKRLFEMEVTEVETGAVEIMAISRDPGARTKIAVRSNEEGIDPIGACVGPNGSRVNAVVDELGGEKIDIICWSDNPEILIKNALSPAKASYVTIDLESRSARVVVPDNQLSLAIGREGQNARLAARLTGYRIDIKSESQDYEEEE
ncbi:MAG: transcription termination/antitermination protein NusA [Lachnospiraceae bacterium]|nr:transcription termination/antitermination protein NusA [Lachnospiraceae bacterium]